MQAHDWRNRKNDLMHFIPYGVSAALAISAQVKVIVNPFIKSDNSDINTTLLYLYSIMFYIKHWSHSDNKNSSSINFRIHFLDHFKRYHTGVELLKWGYAGRLWPTSITCCRSFFEQLQFGEVEFNFNWIDKLIASSSQGGLVDRVMQFLKTLLILSITINFNCFNLGEIPGISAASYTTSAAASWCWHLYLQIIIIATINTQNRGSESKRLKQLRIKSGIYLQSKIYRRH